jgi:hypothetical protein
MRFATIEGAKFTSQAIKLENSTVRIALLTYPGSSKTLSKR